jgi:hypothetical protein
MEDVLSHDVMVRAERRYHRDLIQVRVKRHRCHLRSGRLGQLYSVSVPFRLLGLISRYGCSRRGTGRLWKLSFDVLPMIGC